LAQTSAIEANAMANTRLPPKKDVVMALLEKSSVYVHLDPRPESVMVPPWFKNQPQLVLQVGLNMPVPIPDLNVDETGVSCTLSFNRSPQFCRVPWNAIYALVGEDGRGMVWPDDVPPEVASEKRSPSDARPKQKGHLRAIDPNRASTGSGSKRSKKSRSPKVSAEPEEKVPAEASETPSAVPNPIDEAPSSERDGEPSKRKLPPYLRIVK
jgi:hypothetical protein